MGSAPHTPLRRLLTLGLVALAWGVCASATETGDSIRLPEVAVIEAPKANVELTPLQVTTVKGEALRQEGRASMLPTLERYVAGMFVSERGLGAYGLAGGSAGTIAIRGIGGGLGATNNRVLYMINGQPVWAGIFGHNLPDTYQSSDVERVEVVKGPSSLLYGSNAMGGSINVVTRHASRPGFRGGIRGDWGNHSTQHYALDLGLSRNRWNAFATASYESSNGHRHGMRYWLASQYASLDYLASAHWNVQATLQLTQAYAQNPGSLQEPLEDMWSQMQRGSASMSIKNRYSKLTGAIQGYYNWGRHKIDDGHAPDAEPRDYFFRSTDHNAGFTAHETYTPLKGTDISAGFDFKHWGGRGWNEYTLPDTPDKEIIDKSCTEVAGYAMVQQAFADDRLNLNAGLRYEHSSQFGGEWVPQAGFLLKLLKGNTFKFSYGKGFRSPNIRELYMYVPANPDLKPERLDSYEVEVRQKLLGGRLEGAMALFFIDADNLIITRSIDGRPRNMNAGSTINKGFELEGSYDIDGQWSVTANYAYLYTSKTLPCAPRNKLFGSLSYRPGRFSYAIESLSVWGLHTTDDPAVRTRNYSLLSARIGLNLLVRGYGLELYLRGENLTDARYETVHGFPMPGIRLTGGVEIRF